MLQGFLLAPNGLLDVLFLCRFFLLQVGDVILLFLGYLVFNLLLLGFPARIVLQCFAGLVPGVGARGVDLVGPSLVEVAEEDDVVPEA